MPPRESVNILPAWRGWDPPPPAAPPRCCVTLESRSYGPTARVSQIRHVPSPPALRRVQPLGVQSKSNTGNLSCVPGGPPTVHRRRRLRTLVSSRRPQSPFRTMLSTTIRPGTRRARRHRRIRPRTSFRPGGRLMRTRYGDENGSGANPAPASASGDEQSVPRRTKGASGSAYSLAVRSSSPSFFP